jgi:2'-5' RNA ligase
MPRLFVAIVLPEDVQDTLAELYAGIAGARWTPPGQFHLTLAFLGDVAPALLDDLHRGLQGVHCGPFDMKIRGVGHFPPRGQPRVLWAGIEPSEALERLQQRVEKAVQRAGIVLEKRKWFPHVTLARLQGAPTGRVAEFLAAHALFRMAPMPVEAFQLMSSVLRADGAEHTLEHEFDLEALPHQELPKLR